MKISYVSDLHLEFGELNEKLPGGDILILAGDIDLGCNIIRDNYNHWIVKQLNYYDHVIYVLGNHEFYHGDFIKTPKEIVAVLDHENIYILNNDSIIINGVKFVGSTLWTDMNYDPLVMMKCQSSINDFSLIKNGSNKLTPRDTLDEFLISFKFLTKEITPECIVITHHTPSRRSIHSRYKNPDHSTYKLNFAYSNDLDQFILDTQPLLWIHGHTHDSYDYMIDNTYILCNPRGYKGRQINPQFNPYLQIGV